MPAATSATARTALTNVRVFDGHRLHDPSTVVIDGDRIGTDASGATTIDAGRATLLPGLIDALIHPTGDADLRGLRDSGITTGLVMASWPPALVHDLRDRPDLPDLRTAGTPAVGAGGNHATMPGFPQDGIVTTPEQARRFVAARVSDAVDYIKVVAGICSPEGPDRQTLDALVDAARGYGRLVDAGLTPLDALRAATCLPALHFGLRDRGAVTAGLRADLLLVDGDPLVDITVTRRIRRVWCAGVERDV